MTPSTVLATLATARLAGTSREGLLCVLQGCLQAASKARLDAARYARAEKPPRSIRRAVHYLREAGLDGMAEDVLRYWNADNSWTDPSGKGRKKWVESGQKARYQISEPGSRKKAAPKAAPAPAPAAPKPAAQPRVTPEQANARIAEMLAAGRVSPQDAQELTGYLMGLTAEQQRELNRHYKARAGSGPKAEMAKKLAERILGGGTPAATAPPADAPATPSPDVQGEQASASGLAGLEALAADISRLPGMTADARTIADPQRPLADKLKSIAGADVAAFDPLKRASNAKELQAITGITNNEYLRGLNVFHNSYSGDPGSARNPLGVNRRAQETLDKIDSMGATIRDQVVPGLRKLAAAGVTEIDGEPYDANAYADFYEQHAQTVVDEVKKDVLARRDSLLGKTAEAPKGAAGLDTRQGKELVPEEKPTGGGDPYKDAFAGSGDVEAAIAHINALPLAKLKSLAKQHGIYGATTEETLRSELEQELRYKRGVWKDDDAEEEEESPDVPAAPKEAPKPSKPPKDMTSDEAGEWAASSPPGKRGGPDSPLRTALKQTFEDLSMLVEYKHDRLVDLPTLFNRAKAKVPNLTPEEFKAEVKSWWGDRSGKGHEGRAEMHIQNEVHKLRPDQRAMAIDDMPGSDGAAYYYMHLPEPTSVGGEVAPAPSTTSSLLGASPSGPPTASHIREYAKKASDLGFNARGDPAKAQELKKQLLSEVESLGIAKLSNKELAGMVSELYLRPRTKRKADMVREIEDHIHGAFEDSGYVV